MRSCCNPGNLTINSFPQNIKNMQSWHDYWILFAWKFNNKNELKFIETGMALFHHLLLILNNFNSNSCTCSLVELICVVLKAHYCKLLSVKIGGLEILHVPSSGWMTGAKATCLGNIILIIWHFRPNLLGVAKREIMTGACKYDQTFGIFVTKSSRCCIKGNPSYRRQDEWLLLKIRMRKTFWGGKDLSKSPILGCKTVFSSTN